MDNYDVLWWEDGQHQVEWRESSVDTDAFRSYCDQFRKGGTWDEEHLREGLRRRFGIRVNVERQRPLQRGGPDFFEVTSAEGFARGVGAVGEGGELPPVR